MQESMCELIKACATDLLHTGHSTTLTVLLPLLLLLLLGVRVVCPERDELRLFSPDIFEQKNCAARR
jgi:hypothetical protein